MKWDTVIEQKTNELGRFLTGKASTLDFVEPAPKLVSQDDRELRAKILSLASAKAKRLGIRKSTLHYLRRNAKSSGSFRIHAKVRDKLEAEVAC